MMTIEQLQQNILNDAALELQFTACTDGEQAVALALALAAEHGETVDTEEVARAFATLPLTPLTDAELAQIGGGTHSFEDRDVLSSVSTSQRGIIRYRSVRK